MPEQREYVHKVEACPHPGTLSGDELVVFGLNTGPAVGVIFFLLKV